MILFTLCEDGGERAIGEVVIPAMDIHCVARVVDHGTFIRTYSLDDPVWVKWGDTIEELIERVLQVTNDRHVVVDLRVEE